jgi:hypothetical protein
MSGLDPVLEVNFFVTRVMDFIYKNVPTTHVVSVARAVAELAPLTWGQYQAEPLQAVRLLYPPIAISSDDPHTPR